jgi:hypothetical protein
MTATITCVTAQGHELRTDLTSLLTPDLRETARVEANNWIKRLRLVPYDDGRTMRERFLYRGDSLWWFTELYLHKMRRLDAAIAATLALDAATARHAPARLIVDTGDAAVREAAIAFGRARGLPVDAGPPAAARRHGWPSYLIGLTARLSRVRPAARLKLPRSPKVAAFVHTAFWRASADADGPQQEGYIGPVLDALAARIAREDLLCVGVGPRRNFRARRWWDPMAPANHARPLVTPVERLAPRRALRESLALWQRRRALARDVTRGDAIRAAAVWRGVDLWPVLGPELEATALLQWPWSVRAMDEAAAALDALEPDVAVTYAEAGGWGRALVLEARRRGVRSVGLQHGFIYRHWLNYLHEPDEMTALGGDRGFPAPDRTLVFDRQAADRLIEGGRLPASGVVVTGNPRLDDLARRVARWRREDRGAIRRDLGTRDGQMLAVLAAKYTELGDELAALVAAVAALPGVHLVIKPHPAETPDVYRPLTGTTPNITLAPADADLARLLAAADGLVTMNSTVAIDGLVLKVPALVVGLPNNLSPFVDAGVMLGATSPAEVREQLEALLYDGQVRQRLAQAADQFTRQHELGADGRAADRAADEILGSNGIPT